MFQKTRHLKVGAKGSPLKRAEIIIFDELTERDAAEIIILEELTGRDAAEIIIFEELTERDARVRMAIDFLARLSALLLAPCFSRWVFSGSFLFSALERGFSLWASATLKDGPADPGGGRALVRS